MIRIFLTGYMGAGKTTLGKAFARELNVPFIDLDWYIEERFHKSIRELFVERGLRSGYTRSIYCPLACPGEAEQATSSFLSNRCVCIARLTFGATFTQGSGPRQSGASERSPRQK